MVSTAILLAATGLACVGFSWATYLASIPKGTVPARPVRDILLQLGGAGLGIVAILLAMRDGKGPGVLVLVPAAPALLMGTGFLLLLSQRKTPVGDIQVKVGDKLLAFAARNSDGSPFHSDSLAGRRVLIKFFRGGW